MSQFLSDLKVELSPKSDSIWILQYPLVYLSDIAGLIVVPTGFQTDLASVPRLPFAYAAFGGKAHREAIVHDALYRIGFPPYVSFMTANKVFLEAMKVRKKPNYISYPMFTAVCAFGYPSFHKRGVTAIL